MLTRRKFIKIAACFGGATLLGPMKPWQPLTTADITGSAAGELYAGFLLLPEEASVPDFVQGGRGISFDQECDCSDPGSIGETVSSDSISGLRNLASFPLYIPTTLSSSIRLVDANVIRFVQSGDIWKVTITLGTDNIADGLISVWAHPEFPQPYPVWPVRLPSAHDDGPIYPEKVTISQMPGVVLPSMLGYVFLWIEQNILYTLAVEDFSDREAAMAVANSLTQV